tara:strand:+ start:190 stop:393 length:204 start_codon:yes stop_codon:yes gene_type:complete
MKKNISKVIFILITIILIYFIKTNFSEYNFEKSVSACILGQKKKSKTFDAKKARKFCEQEIKKELEK